MRWRRPAPVELPELAGLPVPEDELMVICLFFRRDKWGRWGEEKEGWRVRSGVTSCIVMRAFV